MFLWHPFALLVLYFTVDGADMDQIWLQSKANSCLQPAAAGAKNGQALPGNILWGMAWHEEETKCKIWYQPQPTLGYWSLLRSTSTFRVAWFLCGECGNFLMCYPSSVAAPHHPPCLQHMVQRSLSASKPPCSYSFSGHQSTALTKPCLFCGLLFHVSPPPAGSFLLFHPVPQVRNSSSQTGDISLARICLSVPSFTWGLNGDFQAVPLAWKKLW